MKSNDAYYLITIQITSNSLDWIEWHQ